MVEPASLKFYVFIVKLKGDRKFRNFYVIIFFAKWLNNFRKLLLYCLNNDCIGGIVPPTEHSLK